MASQVDKEPSPGTTNVNNADDIDVIDSVVLEMGHICLNYLYSDVDFLVEEQRLPAHRIILAARCEYFRAMLYGDMAESKQREIRLNVPVDAFKIILGYIYTGTLPLSKLDVDQILDLLDLAHLYGLQNAEAAIKKHLQQNASVSNVSKILTAAHRYSMDELSKACFNFMDSNASDVLSHATFATLCKESLEKVLGRDTFDAPEVKIFETVCKWSVLNPSADIKSVISHVRLPLMSVKDLLHVVRPSGMFEGDQIMDAIDQIDTGKNLPHRSVVLRGMEVACKVFINDKCIATVLDISKLSVINCINLTVPVGGKWIVRTMKYKGGNWDEVGEYALDPNVPKDIHFSDVFARFILVQKKMQGQDEVKAIAKYK